VARSAIGARDAKIRAVQMQHERHIAEEMALDEAALDQVIGQRGVFLTLDDIRQHAITSNICQNTLSQFITQRDRTRQILYGNAGFCSVVSRGISCANVRPRGAKRSNRAPDGRTCSSST
jgi:hypothetical protein